MTVSAKPPPDGAFKVLPSIFDAAAPSACPAKSPIFESPNNLFPKDDPNIVDAVPITPPRYAFPAFFRAKFLACFL